MSPDKQEFRASDAEFNKRLISKSQETAEECLKCAKVPRVPKVAITKTRNLENTKGGKEEPEENWRTAQGPRENVKTAISEKPQEPPVEQSG
jgi:hypothetical protein